MATAGGWRRPARGEGSNRLTSTPGRAPGAAAHGNRAFTGPPRTDGVSPAASHGQPGGSEGKDGTPGGCRVGRHEGRRVESGSRLALAWRRTNVADSGAVIPRRGAWWR